MRFRSRSHRFHSAHAPRVAFGQLRRRRGRGESASPIVPTLACILAMMMALAPVSRADRAADSRAADSRAADSRATDSIEYAIARDLADAVRIADAELEVSERDGHVTLSGAVNSVMDRWRAAEIAKRTIGVESVANQIIIDPPDRSDDEILADVRIRLRLNDSVEKPAIEAHVSGGRVTLTGKADSLAEKRIAMKAAGGVAGVRAVDNQLTIRESVARTDADMRDEIAGLLVHSVYLDDVAVKVTVKDSVATLSGNVGSLAQLERAEQMAQVRGIRRVDASRIAIDPARIDPDERKRRYASVSDPQIKRAVKRSLNFDPLVFHSADKISAHIDEGAVLLKGIVPKLIIKRKAEMLTRDVIGVRRVINELKVEWPGESPTDLQIIKHVQDAIRRSPYLERREVRVHCQQAHVSIYGIVESSREKARAGWLADAAPGVVHVNNRLAVERDWEAKPDEKIKADLERKLRTTLFRSAEELDVAVEEGVAIIRGTVDTWQQWQTVMDLALEAGARHPHNLINVRYHPAHGARRNYIGY